MSEPPTPTPPPLLNDDSDSDGNQLIPNAPAQNVRQTSEIPVPKTPNRRWSRSGTTTPKSLSRRATPRSGTRNSTPGRGSVRRNPSTPYTLRAMAQANAMTPVRTVVRETRRYTPRDDLRLLSRLLVNEKDTLIKKQNEARAQEDRRLLEEGLQSGSGDALVGSGSLVVRTPEPPLQLAPALTTTRSSVERQRQQPGDDFSIAEPYNTRLSEQHHTTTISELDDEQRRISGRMSGRLSFPSNNLPSDLFNDLAVPQAVVDDPSAFDNENFGYDNDFEGLARPNFSSDDDDDADNDLVYSDDEYEFSLLRDQAKATKFQPMTSNLLKKRAPAESSLKIPMSLLRVMSRQALSTPVAEEEDAKFFRQKQFSGNLLSHLQDISDEFLTQQLADLTAFAKHANRKTINSDDFAMLAKRHKSVELDSSNFQAPVSNDIPNKNTELFCLAESFCNTSELREIESNLYKNEVAMAKKAANKKRRKIEVKNESAGSQDSDEGDTAQFYDTRESLD